MPDNPPQDEMRTLWQAQHVEEHQMSLEEIRRKANRFEKRVSRRNLREYIAAVVVVLVFGAFMVHPPERKWNRNVARTACGLEILAALYVSYQLHTRGATRKAPSDLPVAPSLELHRSALVQQRDLLDSVWSWYLLPFVPGMLVLALAFAFPPDGRMANPAGLAVMAAFVTAVFVWIARLNKRVARKLQRRIDALDALHKE